MMPKNHVLIIKAPILCMLLCNIHDGACDALCAGFCLISFCATSRVCCKSADPGSC